MRWLSADRGTCRHRQPSPESADAGTVTAELAMAMPAVVLLLVVLLIAVDAGVTEIRCVDAARAGARVAARGDPTSAIGAAARQLAPRAAGISIATDGDLVRVAVAAPVGTLGLHVPGLTVSGSAVASVEPTR